MDSPYPHPASEQVSRVMRGNRRRDTMPERALRRELHRRGFRYRVDLPLRVPSGIVRPDIVFTRCKVCVFIDGCFWHSCPEHGHVPGGANSDYWQNKLARNRLRDERNNQELGESGWTVVRVWEHENVDEACARIESVLNRSSDHEQ